MRGIQDAITKTGKHLAEIAQAVVKVMDNLTPEQRIVIEFLTENPEIAEAFQELNQKLAKQKAMGVGKVQSSKVPYPHGFQKYSFEVLISDEFVEYASKDLLKARLMFLLEEEIDKQLEEE